MKQERAGNLLRWVECFLVVAEVGHIGRAAETLGMSQPPLSQTIRRLECAVGETLFLRHARGVSLSPAGQAFLPRAQELMAARRRVLALSEDVALLDRSVRMLLPRSVPAAWVGNRLLSPGADFTGARWASAPSSEIVREVRGAPTAVGVVVAPIVTDELVALPVVAVAQDLVTTAVVEKPVSRRTLRRAVGPVLLTAPRTDGPAAHDVLAAELESLGVAARLKEVADPLQLAAEIRVARAAALVPHSTPGVDGIPLEDGVLPLRLRVLHHPDAEPAAREAATLLQTCLSRCGDGER